MRFFSTWIAEALPFEKDLLLAAQALSHPVRLAILILLNDRKRRLSGEITAALPLPRTTVSQHLVALRKSKLLRAEAQGLTVAYWLNSEVAPTVLRRLAAFCAGICRCPVCGKGEPCGCFREGRQ